MKKNLLTLALSCLAVASLRADLIYKETFPYTNGIITVTGTNANGTTNWFQHSGVTFDAFVNNQRLEVSAGSGGGPVSRSSDVNRPFTSQTNTFTPLYASFIVNVTNLPPANGNYFAHYIGNVNQFYGRVWALTGNCGGTSNVFCALPGTYRIGISAQNLTGSPTKIFPVDLATNTDYQVVVYFDPVSTDPIPLVATLWVNPMSSTDANYTTTDSVSQTNILQAYAFRQTTAFGNFFCTVSNLAVATTFDEAATNVWASNSIPPYLAFQPKSRTNFVGDPVNISAVANGQGFSSFNYQWRKSGGNVSNPNGNNNVFTISSAATSDIGNYDVVVSNTFSGASVTSVVAFLWVTNPPVPPTITPTTNSTVATFYHQSATLQTVITGPSGPTAQWYYNGAPATGGNVSGADTDTITITDVFTNNGTAGAYYCVASNPFGSKTSGVFTVTAVAPPAVSIAFLRTLVDPVNYNATNSSSRWQITGIVTTSTNLTSGDTSSYYLQDSSGCGINIFVTFGHDFRPNQGDVVTFVGFMSSFNSNLELEADTNDVSTSMTIWSNNIAGLPPQKAIPFTITNNLAFCETNLEGSIVMLTNVYFGTNAGNLVSTNNNFPVTVNDGNGNTFTLFFSPQVLDTTNRALPSFANTVVGPLTQNLGNTVTPRNAGYQVTITRWSDIVTNPITLSDSHSGNSTVLTWPASPYSYAYSVLSSLGVNGPYTAISSNLHFPNANGTFTDSNASSNQKYYRLSTP